MADIPPKLQEALESEGLAIAAALMSTLDQAQAQIEQVPLYHTYCDFSVSEELKSKVSARVSDLASLPEDEYENEHDAAMLAYLMLLEDWGGPYLDGAIEGVKDLKQARLTKTLARRLRLAKGVAGNTVITLSGPDGNQITFDGARILREWGGETSRSGPEPLVRASGIGR